MTPEFEAYVSLDGLIDVAAEMKRLEKQLAEKRKFAQAHGGEARQRQLREPGAAEVVQQQREQVAELQKQIATMEANLRELQAG